MFRSKLKLPNLAFKCLIFLSNIQHYEKIELQNNR